MRLGPSSTVRNAGHLQGKRAILESCTQPTWVYFLQSAQNRLSLLGELKGLLNGVNNCCRNLCFFWS